MKHKCSTQPLCRSNYGCVNEANFFFSVVTLNTKIYAHVLGPQKCFAQRTSGTFKVAAYFWAQTWGCDTSRNAQPTRGHVDDSPHICLP